MARPYWTRTGLRSIEALGDYLDAASPGYAGRLLEGILDAVQVLDEYPRIGRVVPEINEATFRELIFQKYRIVYELTEGRPCILLVVHAATDLEAELRRRGIRPS